MPGTVTTTLPSRLEGDACRQHADLQLRERHCVSRLKRSAKLSLAVWSDAPISRAVRRRIVGSPDPAGRLSAVDRPAPDAYRYDVHQQSRTKSEHECRFISVHATRLPRNGVGMTAKHATRVDGSARIGWGLWNRGGMIDTLLRDRQKIQVVRVAWDTNRMTFRYADKHPPIKPTIPGRREWQIGQQVELYACGGRRLCRQPAHRTEAQRICHQQNGQDHGHPLRPPFAPIDQPHRHPDAEGCNGDGEDRQDDSHAQILPRREHGGKVTPRGVGQDVNDSIPSAPEIDSRL